MKPASAITLLALILALSATSCLIIPMPHYDSGYARTNVVQHTQQQFAPGQTTRADVLLALGEPDAVSRDEHQLAYRSEKIMALWIVGGGNYATGGNIYKNRFYVFEFNPDGLYQTNRQTGQFSMVEGADEPQLISPAFKSEGTNGMSVTEAGEPVRHEYPKSFWLAGVDGYHSQGSTSLTGQPGRLWLTETNLAFMTESQFANTAPALSLPFTALSEARVDKFFMSRRLVVRLQSGEIHAFAINSSGGIWQDKPAMQTVCDLIQSKIKSPQPEP